MLTATQRFRVEWAHCDPAGIIFNPNYYIWMDSGTHALLQAAGYDLIGNTHGDPLFRGCPLVASNMAFKRPLYFGDIALLTSRVEKFGNTSFVVAHEFSSGDDPAGSAAAAGGSTGARGREGNVIRRKNGRRYRLGVQCIYNSVRRIRGGRASGYIYHSVQRQEKQD
jgi:YbgC/YbaW family acyl-CoA thioester hydrolase